MSVEFSETDIFLLQLTCGHGHVSAHIFPARPTKVLHPLSKISPLKMSLSGYKSVLRCAGSTLEITHLLVKHACPLWSLCFNYNFS